MSKYLVIVESPTKVKTISKFLSGDYEVDACGGHLRDLPKSKMGVDPEKNFEPQYIVITKKKKVVASLKKAVKGKEVLYLACDPDREGEAIAWHISEIMQKKTVVKRVVFNEITKDVIVRAFKNSREIDMNKVNAQQARRILDRLVGYELSPLLWKKVGRGLSAGRVQSVALRIIVKREREIQAFIKKEYWEIEADLKKREPEASEFKAKLEKIKGEKPEIKTEEEAKEICSSLEEKTFSVSDVKKRAQKRYPKPPFITSSLQQTAFNKLRFTASRTMIIAQQLYEGLDIAGEGSVGLITYMRTDSVTIADTAQKEARDFILDKFGTDYLPAEMRKYKSKKLAQGAHEAIRPTSIKRTPESVKDYLSKEQYELYKIIWQQFTASCMKEAEISVTSISITAGDCLFKASGSKVIFKGFMIVFEEEGDEKKVELPAFIKGEELVLLKLIPSQHFTQPPPRFTDASLVKILEEEGIGRPSTYAPTIRTIIFRDYIRRESRSLVPSELGIVVNDLLIDSFPDVLDIKFTAKMEEELDRVEQGALGWQELLKGFYEPFAKELEAAKIKMRDVKKEVIMTDKVCEKCGKPMVIKWSKYGKFLSCSGFPECKNAKSIDTGIKCPNEGCDGMLVMRRSKRGRVFYGCTKYPECNFITNKLPEE